MKSTIRCVAFFILVALLAAGSVALGQASAGTIVAWGSNEYGQCTVPTPNAGYTAVAAGSAHSLGLKTDGSIVALGDNTYGQCNVPSPNTGFTAVAAGGGTSSSHSLGLKTDGSIVAWGYNNWGQCNVPLPNAGFTAVVAGSAHSLGLKTDGTIVAWGDNTYGQCSVPSPNTGFTAVAAGYCHSLGLKTDGSIVAWGYNNWGQCYVPLPNTGFTAMAAGVHHNLGLKTDGSIVAWGSNEYGQCTVPTPNAGFTAVEADWEFSLGLKGDGAIVAWGKNDYGQCNVPTPSRGFTAAAAGGYHSLAILGYLPADVLSVLDVPQDQGGWVRLTIGRSALDGDGDDFPIATYNVWQRIDDLAFLGATAAGRGAGLAAYPTKASDPALVEAVDAIKVAGWDVKKVAGRYFVQSSELPNKGTLPPGDWEIIGSFAACQQDQYIYRASTLADVIGDKIPYSVYMVSAHTTIPSIWFASAPDSGYSIDNLAPQQPRDLAGNFFYQPESLLLTWRANTEADFSHYSVYRSAQAGFVPSSDNLLTTTPSPQLNDPDCTPTAAYFYKLSAVDRHGNSSSYADYASAGAVANYVSHLSAVAEPGRCIIRWQVMGQPQPGDFRVWRSVGTSGFEPLVGGAVVLENGGWALADRDVESGQNYAYRVFLVIGSNETLLFETIRLSVPQVVLRLYQNHPNPFNPRTTIRFDLPVAGQAQLSIYDLAGRLVRVLVEGEIPAGSHEAVWDGRDAAGRAVPSGSYLARLVAGGKVEGVRLSLVR
jgi:hypothetical protein